MAANPIAGLTPAVADPAAERAAVDQMLEDLATLHERLQAGYLTMLAKPDASAAWQRTADERWQQLRGRYQACARAVVTTVAREELERRRERLATRLANGWARQPRTAEEAQQIDERFRDLLSQYEALSDVLNGLEWLAAELAMQVRRVLAARVAVAKEQE